MPANLPDFDKAEYPGQPPAPTAEAQVHDTAYEDRAWDRQSSDHDRFVHAIVYGVVAAIVGSIVYAAFTIITHIEIGYLAVGVG